MIPTQQDMQQQKEALAALKEEISRLDPSEAIHTQATADARTGMMTNPTASFSLTDL